ncbi:MAG: hypothetical protein DRJ51_02305 [Thermoprotei archaeon]|nr:MAG: hypothetical protein DRJ51_02305 [Thermoprotei archaeon]RLF01986.1 MAG: hypothetical protein DRJ59_04785 [Thermoprotei archaeon]
MILVISTCKVPFSEEEFVRPITEIVESCGYSFHIKRYHEKIDFDEYSKIIVCGTALRDFDYLNYVDVFKPLLNYAGKVLGICAGYQILALLYENRLEEVEKIGIHKVRVIEENPLMPKNEFYAYFLHIYALSRTNDKLKMLAVQNGEICAFKVLGKDFYGVAFHPEVLNREIVERFVSL